MAKLSVDQALLKAKSLAKKGEIEEAQKLYQTVLKAFPKNKRAQQELAAVNGSKQTIDVPEPPQEAINQLVNLYNQGQMAAVTEQATSLIEQYPEAFIVWNILGAANKGLNRVAGASNAFRRVTELNPNYADGFNNLGIVLKDQGKLDEAIEAYTKALTIKPDHVEANYNIGNALKEHGKLDEALEAYTKALSLKPDYAEAYNNMGNALRDQGKLEEAIASYNKALSLKPDYAEAARNLVKLPVGCIDEQTISELNKKLSLIYANIDDQSQKLFFEANLFSHKAMYEEAFKIFIDANSLKSGENILSVKSEQKQFDAAIKRISRWSVHLQSEQISSIKKLFLLGPSRSGKSTLEKLLTGSPNVYPMFENINLKGTGKSECSMEETKKPSMLDLFYHDENSLLKLGYNVVTSTKPDTMFQIDHMIDLLSNSFCIFVKRNRTDIASEIFATEYRRGNFYSYDHSSILKYLDTYEAIWEILRQKVPHLTLEISFEDILSEPLETIKKISQMTGVSLEVSNPPNSSITNLSSPFREHYASYFMAS